MKKVILASFILTGCVNLSPADVTRILDRIEKELDYGRTPAPVTRVLPRGSRPTPPQILNMPVRMDKADPAPAATAEPKE